MHWAKKALYIAGAFIPMLSIYTNVMMENIILGYIHEKDPEFKGKPVLCAVTSVFLPMFMNVVDMVEKDRLFNKIVDLDS